MIIILFVVSAALIISTAVVIGIIVSAARSPLTYSQHDYIRREPAYQRRRRHQRTRPYTKGYVPNPSTFRQQAQTSAPTYLEFDQTNSLRSIHELNWYEFELLCKTYFEKRGFKVIHTPAKADGGIDLILYDDSGKKLVQAKSHRKWVGVNLVRELLGVVTSEGSAEGVFVSRNGFTPDAKEFAIKNQIELVDGGMIMRFFGATTEYFVTPEMLPGEKPVLCPRCSLPMVERTSKSGPNFGEKFYGCSRYPKCFGTRRIEMPPPNPVSA